MTQQLRDRLGRFGIWRSSAQVTPDLAASVERLGYGAVWLGGSPDGKLEIVSELLAATNTLMVGTSIVNIWKDDAATVARSYGRIETSHPGRFVLGVGAGHPEATKEYASPYAKLSTYVDQLRAAGVPAEGLVLAGLGPRVLKLAGDRAAGAIPYLVPPEHTRLAREILGPDRLLAPEQKAVLDPEPERGRALGRNRVQPYLHLVNYTSNLRRLGFADEDLAGRGSDRLIDALVAHGRPDQVAAQLSAHLDAGADHVAVQLLTENDAGLTPGYADLASALGLQG